MAVPSLLSPAAEGFMDVLITAPWPLLSLTCVGPTTVNQLTCVIWAAVRRMLAPTSGRSLTIEGTIPRVHIHDAGLMLWVWQPGGAT